MNMEQAIQDLQDAMTVMAHLEKRQSEMLLDHSQRIAESEEHQRRTERNFEKIQEYQQRTDQNLSEITDKLNGLIGYIDGLRRPPPS